MANKLISSYKTLRTLDFFRKIISVLVRMIDLRLYSKMRTFYHFKTTRVIIGRNVCVHGLAFNIQVGHHTRFYDNCVFEFDAQSEITIGSHVVFSYGVVFCCRRKISIGNDVQIGEYSSLRDSTHDYRDTTKTMKYSIDIEEPISIGDNVWIGRGCLIMPGTVVEEGVVVAANSVVKGRLEKNGVYGGVPAKLIKFRQ